jgi:hypothetical protein
MRLEIIFLVVIFSVLASGIEYCAPNVTLLNQDPYPAVPGDYVKIVFQVSDIATSRCGDITARLIQNYPLVFDSSESGLRIFNKVDYVKDFSSNLMVPYKVRVDENALDGANPIEFQVQNKGGAILSSIFDLEVEDTRTLFQVFVYDYDYLTSELTFQILNTGSSDIEALAVEIPKQDNVVVKGSNIEIVGDLDSNEYTTASFEAKPEDGKIKLNLHYSDGVNVRRTLEEEIFFDSSYFKDKFSQQKSTSIWTYVFLVLVVVAIVYFILKRRKNKRREKEER